jgi:hypothetical protein
MVESSVESFERDDRQSSIQLYRVSTAPRTAKVVSVTFSDDSRLNQQTSIVICLSDGCRVDYLKRTLAEVKGLMAKVKRRMRSPGEQSQVERWLLDLDHLENARNIVLIGLLVDSFFDTVLSTMDGRQQQLEK